MLRLAPGSRPLSNAPRFRCAPSGTLRIVPLDDLTAIYHRASGQTHVVAEPVPQILDALGDEARTFDDLIGRLRLPDDNASRELLSERLGELCLSGLVEHA